MGEFFKEDKAREEKKEEKLILDPQELFMAYNVLTNKIQMMTNEGYEVIIPIRTELTGLKQTPDDTGQVGHLRRRIEGSRIARMDIGIMMWGALKNIEDLDRWSERHIKFLEDYLDAMQHIARSSFKIISNLHAKINNLQAIQNQMQLRGYSKEIPKRYIPEKRVPLAKKDILPAAKGDLREYAPKRDEHIEPEEPVEEVLQEDNEEESPEEREVVPLPPPPPFVEPPMPMRNEEEGPPQIDVFNELIDQKIEEYRVARVTGDEKKIEAGRRQLYELCGRDASLRARVKSLITRLDMEL